ncbi:hypothetical protein ACQ86D_20340 [Streptomyces galilaeus]
MGQLDDDRGGDDPRRVGIAELCGEHHEERPEPLPARAHEMLGGLRDEGHLALGGFEQTLLDCRHSGLDIGFQSLVPHAQPERPDDGHEGSPVCWCPWAVTRIVDRSLPSLKSAYPVGFRSPMPPTPSTPGGIGS